jgi:hypothetical protein
VIEAPAREDTSTSHMGFAASCGNDLAIAS